MHISGDIHERTWYFFSQTRCRFYMACSLATQNRYCLWDSHVLVYGKLQQNFHLPMWKTGLTFSVEFHSENNLSLEPPSQLFLSIFLVFLFRSPMPCWFSMHLKSEVLTFGTLVKFFFFETFWKTLKPTWCGLYVMLGLDEPSQSGNSCQFL